MSFREDVVAGLSLPQKALPPKYFYDAIGSRLFERGESIHTENSYKYSVPEFERLAANAGFAPAKLWTDARGWFGVFGLRAA